MTGTAATLYRPQLPAPPALSAAPPVVSGAGGVPVYWTAAPLSGPVRGMIAPAGTSIAAIVARALAVDPALDREFCLTGIVTINGEPVPRAWWPLLRVRRMPGYRVVVVLHPGLGKGGGNVLGQVIQIAALVAAIALTGPFGVAAALSLTATQAGILALGITVAGSLAAAALSPPPTSPQLGGSSAVQGTSAQLGRAGISGNALAPGAPVPRMTGERRYAPPFWCNPYAYIDGDDEVVEACWAFAGATALDAVRLGSVSIDDMPDAQIQIGEGRPGDGPLTLIDRITATEQVGIDVSRHRIDPSNGDRLKDQVVPENSLPVAHPMIGGQDADEIIFTIECAGGLIDLASPASALSVPVRVAFRRRGDAAWRNAPEIHFATSTGQPFRKTFKLVFETPPIFVSKAPAADAPILAYKTVPGQTVFPARVGWEADPYFSSASGGDLMSAATFNAHNVRNISLESGGATLHLDPAVFPPGTYEIRATFGAVYNTGSFTAATYTLGGTVYDLFGYYSTGGIYKLPRTRAQLRDEFAISRCASIWHQSPLPQPEGSAFIAVRVRNRQLGEMSVSAAGLVPQWNGSEWTGLAATRNPAPHFRARLAQAQPEELIDDTPIVAWESFCDTQGYETCAVLVAGSIMDALNLIASAGRGRPRQSEVWSVLFDYDTAAVETVQTFSLRNCRDFGIAAPMAEPSGGFRVRFADRTRDHKENHIIVRNPNAGDLSLPLEEMVNEAQDDETEVRKRALYDLL
ncbi:MAG: hypothetical protein Q8M03_06980, partial [Legionella sp.]|nr:hypothetical protein [Legionella sp.]